MPDRTTARATLRGVVPGSISSSSGWPAGTSARTGNGACSHQAATAPTAITMSNTNARKRRTTLQPVRKKPGIIIQP